jgi:hypothetical protein
MSKVDGKRLADLGVHEVAEIWAELLQVESEIDAVDRTDAPTFAELEGKERRLERLRAREHQIRVGLGLEEVRHASSNDEQGQQMSLTTAEVSGAFTCVPQLKRMLGDVPNHAWLRSALLVRGKAPKPHRWCPVQLAELLRTRELVSVVELNKAFISVPALRPWRSAWQEVRAERNAFGR